ncbi:hypothetical protein SAMN04490243_0888 [Robiginitalea myxolifaciens]|uniref:Uncharacterized protein n=1 Tax=Robiginitalea myxolifaciens TaxID=400055 RepID=A0A1I6FY88_9FLAO|nr:hypothetical protein [Robiginitalea myxolifaciens]SFR34797.1 hypothetical protein SAMN04490243_0888 [Robiginitalea myxolifaciens]
MKKKNSRKTLIGVSFGILLAWVLLISWALYKEMETDMIVLFVVMMLSTSFTTLASSYATGNKACSSSYFGNIFKKKRL